VTIYKYLLKQSLMGLGFIVFIFSIGFFFVYLPLVSQLREQTYENYRLISSQKQLRIEQFISNSIEGASSLSSRTMIRDAIGDYWEGDITLNDLSDYTQPRYEDGVDVLNNLETSMRVVDNQIISKVPLSNADILVDDIDLITTTEFRVISEDEHTFLIVISPIILVDAIVGHDIVEFNMSDFLDGINESDETCTAIETEEPDGLLNGAQILIEEEGYVVIKKDQDIIYLSDGLMSSEAVFIKVNQNLNALESDIKNITSDALILDGIIFILFFCVFFYFISRASSSRIKLANLQKEIYQKRANKDALTNVYTRYYLTEWIKKISENNLKSKVGLTVVMCDINGFKQYNDQYGHDAGDQVLIKVGQVMNRYANKNEVVIRYGGDEFLLVSKDYTREQCDEVMKEVNSALLHEYNICLAYGIVVAKTIDDFDSALALADKRMYRSKKMNI